ncbi:MAG: hypothetical protein ACXW39_03160, partial [Nitrospira sp.]
SNRISSQHEARNYEEQPGKHRRGEPRPGLNLDRFPVIEQRLLLEAKQESIDLLAKGRMDSRYHVTWLSQPAHSTDDPTTARKASTSPVTMRQQPFSTNRLTEAPTAIE